MPSLRDHREAAQQYLKAYKSLPQDCALAKAALLAYCALHIVEAVAASEGVHNRNHRQRNDYLRARHRALHRAYKPLQDAGYFARYRPRELGLTSEDIDARLRSGWLQQLDEQAKRILGESILG